MTNEIKTLEKNNIWDLYLSTSAKKLTGSSGFIKSNKGLMVPLQNKTCSKRFHSE